MVVSPKLLSCYKGKMILLFEKLRDLQVSGFHHVEDKASYEFATAILGPEGGHHEDI
jgi:hypothetical protein